jgi:HEPN domain-containing protein
MTSDLQYLPEATDSVSNGRAVPPAWQRDDSMLKATENWLVQADYDLATAEHMLHAGRYIYVIFMSHLALEKALKALVTEETQQLPPRTHNLIDLAQRAHVVLSQEHQDFIGKINNASVVVRYPDDLAVMVSQYSETIARDYLERTKELITWVRQDPRLQPS